MIYYRSSLYYPNLLQLFFNEVNIFRSLLKEEEWTKMSIDSIYTLIRRIFIHFKKVIQKICYENEIQKILLFSLQKHTRKRKGYYTRNHSIFGIESADSHACLICSFGIYDWPVIIVT